MPSLKPAYIQSDTDLLTRPSYDAAATPLLYSDPTLHRLDVPHLNIHTPSQNSIHDSDSHYLDAASHDHLNAPSGKNTTLRSAMEIRNQHYQKQQQYAEHGKHKRHRNITGIDFEGILNLIGGCNKWQLMIYIFISAQQIPHAMFNLSVVYMMYQPDHWCKMGNYSEQGFTNGSVNTDYNWDQVLSSNIAYPQKLNSQRKSTWHSQCDYYDRDYSYLQHFKWDEIQRMNLSTDVPLLRCEQWEYDTSVMKSTIVTDYNRVCDNNWSRAHVHLSYSLGYLLGCWIGGYVSDKWGRRYAIYGFSIMSAVFGIMLIYSQEFETFLVIRFLLAASNEAADLAAYVMCMEVTGVKYRSLVGSMLQAPWALGYAFLALLAFQTKSWKTIQLYTTILHICSIFLIHFLPESPRWLIMKNRVNDAETIIRKACKMNDKALPSDLGLVRHDEKEKLVSEEPSYFDLFKTTELCLRHGTLLVIWMATALVYYGLVIALSDQSSPGRSVFDGNFFLNNAIAGAIEIPTLVACVFLLRMGRKKKMVTLIGAGILITVAMIATSEGRPTAALIFMMGGKACIQGAFNILYIFTSELSPTIVRNRAVGVSSMMARMGAGASGYIAILSDVTLAIVPMLIFAVFSLVAGLLVIFLPETQDLPLPDTIWDAVLMRTHQQPCTIPMDSDQHAENEVYKPAKKSDNYEMKTMVSTKPELNEEDELRYMDQEATTFEEDISQSQKTPLPASSYWHHPVQD